MRTGFKASLVPRAPLLPDIKKTRSPGNEVGFKISLV